MINIHNGNNRYIKHDKSGTIDKCGYNKQIIKEITNINKEI